MESRAITIKESKYIKLFLCFSLEKIARYIIFLYGQCEILSNIRYLGDQFLFM